MVALARFVAEPSVPCRRADYNWGLEHDPEKWIPVFG
jgi:hypothetical protein